MGFAPATEWKSQRSRRLMKRGWVRNGSHLGSTVRKARCTSCAWKERSEAVESEIDISQTGVNQGEGEGRDEALLGLGDGLEGPQDFESFFSATCFGEDVAAKRKSLGVACTEATGLVESVEGLLVLV